LILVPFLLPPSLPAMNAGNPSLVCRGIEDGGSPLLAVGLPHTAENLAALTGEGHLAPPFPACGGHLSHALAAILAPSYPGRERPRTTRPFSRQRTLQGSETRTRPQFRLRHRVHLLKSEERALGASLLVNYITLSIQIRVCPQTCAACPCPSAPRGCR
jgi:hypothetical protein